MAALASGLRVRVVESGAAGAPPVVLFSGWGGSVYTFRKNLPALAGAGFRAIAVDLKGHGLSDKPRDPAAYTAEAMTAHAIEILDALGLPQVRLVGQSMAGAIATRVALAAPDRVSALALIGAVGFGRAPTATIFGRLPLRAIDWIEPAASRWTFAAVLRHAYGSLDRPTAADVEQYYAPTSDPNHIRALFLLLREFDWRLFTPEECARLRVPMLIIFGAEDRMVSPRHAERLGERLRDARILMVPRAGHVVNEEAPDLVNQALVEFLRT